MLIGSETGISLDDRFGVAPLAAGSIATDKAIRNTRICRTMSISLPYAHRYLAAPAEMQDSLSHYKVFWRQKPLANAFNADKAWESTDSGFE